MLAGRAPPHELWSTGCTGLSLMGLEYCPWTYSSSGMCKSKCPSEMVLGSAQTASGVDPSGFMAFSGIIYAAGSILGAGRFVLR